MKKSTLLMVLSLVLALTIGLGTTLAYLTDTDADVNVMTLGNVDIEQIEQERDENGDLQDFSQNKPLYPAVFEGSSIPWAPENEWVVPENQAWKVVEDNENVVDKFVTVENTGKSDAYVRTIIAYEGDDTYGPEGAYIHVVHNGGNVTPAIDIECIGTVNIDGVDYTVYVYTYPEALAAGETSIPSLKQIYMNKAADNDVVAQYGETYDVLVVSQAVQTAGFEDVNENGTAADEALNEAFGKITAENHPWLGVAPNDAPTKLNVVGDADSVLEALQNGKDVYGEEGTDGELIIETTEAISLDAEGAEVVLNGNTAEKKYGYLGFVPPKGEDVKLSNLNVTGTGFVEVGHHPVGTYGGGEYTLNNVEIKNLVATLAIGNNGNTLAPAFSHYGDATLNDCVMKGTTAGNSAATAYDAAFSNSTKTTIDGGEYGKIYVYEHAHVTIKDAKVDVIDSYAMVHKGWGKLVIGEGAEVGTINLNRCSGYDCTLTIEEGAKVGTIIYDDETYTQDTWVNQ